MRDDIGMDGIRRVLGSVGIGHFWDDTYREASGKSWSGSLGTFADRLKGSAPRYPGVAFARDTPDGPA